MYLGEQEVIQVRYKFIVPVVHQTSFHLLLDSLSKGLITFPHLNPHESRNLCLEKSLPCSLNAFVIKYSIQFLLSLTFSYICLSLVLVGWLEIFHFSSPFRICSHYCRKFSNVIKMSQNSSYILFLLILNLRISPQGPLASLLHRF